MLNEIVNYENSNSSSFKTECDTKIVFNVR